LVRRGKRAGVCYVHKTPAAPTRCPHWTCLLTRVRAVSLAQEQLAHTQSLSGPLPARCTGRTKEWTKEDARAQAEKAHGPPDEAELTDCN
ncbi:hypothetical protein BaRGS_00008103, partial [Batillaria attramentaria]